MAKHLEIIKKKKEVRNDNRKGCKGKQQWSQHLPGFICQYLGF